MSKENYREAVANYEPFSEEEIAEKGLAELYVDKFSDIVYRNNRLVHLTTSAFIVNPERDKVLMVYHNIYDSWSWVGGHCDGEDIPLDNAIKEMKEETGVENFKIVSEKPISLNLLTVKSHYSGNKYIVPHIHLDLTYLFEVSEDENIRIKEDENSDIGWIKFSEVSEKSSEPHMIPIYEKIIDRVEKEFK